MTLRRVKAGMNLSEILIVIALLGIIVVCVTPFLMQNGTKQKLASQEKNTVESLQTAVSLENASLGLLPVQFGPGKVFQSRLKAKDLQAVTLAENQCDNPPLDRPIGNHAYQLPSGIIVVTDDSWDDYNYRPSSKEKVMGRQACLLLKGLDSDPAKGEIAYTTLYRDGQADAALASNGTTDGEQINGGNSTTVTNTPVNPPDGIDPNNPPPVTICDSNLGPFINSLLSKYAKLFSDAEYINDHPNTDMVVMSNRWVVILNDIYQTNIAAANYGGILGYAAYVGGAYRNNMAFTSRFLAINAKLEGNGDPLVSDADLDELDIRFPGMKIYMKNAEVIAKQAHYSVGSVINQLYNLEQKLCPPGESQSDDGLRALLQAKQQFLYEFMINGTFVSPIKINLKGQDAQVNSDGDFLFATVGFRTKGRNLVVKTAGGLNPDEAWLVADRGHLGFVSKNGILDGQDVFGDHLGTFPSGYEDLAARYKKFVVKDSHGKHFIPLHQLNWWESFWIWLMHFLGFDKTPNPSYELKLLPKNYHAIPASNVLEAVYVDYQNVDELDADKQNWVRQRGVVVYRDGHKATGVDQWFQVKLMKTQPEL